MSLVHLLPRFQADPNLHARITAWERIPARPPVYAAWPDALDPRLPLALAARGIARPYSHQAQATELALAGHHTLVVTPTASGKTLAYNLPVLHWLLNDPDARALYLFPTKALAQDQLQTLQDLIEVLQADIPVAVYDGDTPKAHRKRIREGARILLTNPDMLHAGILPHHTAWNAFFRGLRAVVIDEIHIYRGVFGSHVANVLRRLRRIADFYQGATGLESGERASHLNVTYLLASATIANPVEHAERLIEAPVALVARNGAPTGEKHVIFLNPPLVDRDLGLRRSNLLEAQQWGATLLAEGVQTIFFARSRMTAELLLTYLREGLERKGVRDVVVRGYRGGYLPRERRAIERGLREGAIHGVVATNALELGVDIGQLGAAVLTGFPGTIASAWQQAGRAGRRGDLSLAMFIAGGGALDQYIVQHPDFFFGRSPEHARINPDNLVILLAHLRCAAFELPFRTGEDFGRFQFTEEALVMLAEEGEVMQAGDRWFWTSESYPAGEVSLRTASPDRILILEADGGETIGEMDRETAPPLLHEGAIYLHEGRAYLVEHLDWEEGHAWVRPVEVDYATRAISASQADVLAVHDQKDAGPLLRGWGEVAIRSRVTGFKRVKRWTHEVLGYGEVDLPETVLETTGYWLALADDVVDALRAARLWTSAPNDYGPNWPEQRAKARAGDGYRCVLCGASEPPGRTHDVHHIRPFRTFGYIPGVNENYRLANRLENLRTLCRTCHQKVERGQRLRSGLSGLAYLLHNLAPLHLMCDPSDLGYLVEPLAPHTGRPTIILYDRAPGGIGLSERLYDLQPQLLEAAREMVSACGCSHGCPACVGPVTEGAEALDWDAKALTLALLNAILA
ncbi:MAG TPA: DEAD/DEAH box helicase [Caldilineae bacterium]|nr:DEAD/DEAH box helicase [Caldilineae bacterium]